MAPLGTDPMAQQIPPAAPQGPQVPFSGMHQQQLTPPSVNPAMPNTSMEGAPGAPTGDMIQVFRVPVSAAGVRRDESLTPCVGPSAAAVHPCREDPEEAHPRGAPHPEDHL